MFIGHYAVGFGSKRISPSVSLGTLFLATQFLDLIWPFFVILGFEHLRIDPGNTAFTPADFYDYPYSHSLLTVVGWGLLLGGIHYWRKRQKLAATVVGSGVVSHWVLDFISHRPDLPLAPGLETRVGLGLWNSVPATFLVEGILYTAGVTLYLKTTRAADRTGTIALWALVVLLPLIWVINELGPPPPGDMAVAYSALAAWLFVAWGYWIDRHRTVRNGTTT
jgi:hypothetical protein